MNCNRYRTIFSKRLGMLVPVAEIAKTRSKGSAAKADGGSPATQSAAAATPILVRRPLSAAVTAALAPAMLVMSLAAALPSAAADLYWDPNGGTTGRGGNGSWNVTDSFWTANADGTSGPFGAWNNALDNAIFGGTAGTVTLGAPITVQNITFESSSYRIAGSTLTLAGAAPTINLGSTGDAIISSILAGTDGLTITGANGSNSYMYLQGANTITGGITIDSGRLITNGSNNVLNGANNVVTINNGAILDIQHSNAFGGDTAASRLVMNDGATLWLGNANLAHDITANGGTITIQDPYTNGIAATWTGALNLTADTTLQVTGTDNNTTFAGNLSDTGVNQLSLALNANTLILTGTNSFTGGTTVNGGTLILSGADSASGAGNVVTINGGAVYANINSFGGDTDASRLIINDGGLFRVDAWQNVTHDVTLGGGTVSLDGLGNATWNGTAVLTADTLVNFGVGGHSLTVTGDLFDNGGVLSLGTAGTNVYFTGDLSFTGDFTLDGLNTWFNGGTHTYSGATIITDAAGLILNSATTLSPNSNFVFDGTDPAARTVIYLTNAFPEFTLPVGTGAGEIQWTGSGGFFALGGHSDSIVNLGGAGATLTWGAGGFVPDGDVLILGTDTTNGNARELDFQNGIDLNGAVRTVRADYGNYLDHAVLSGVLSGTGGLQVAGNGLLELSGVNTYSGPTIVGDGVTNGDGLLILGSVDALSPNTNLQINGLTNTNGIADGATVLLTAESGDFTTPLGTGAGQVQWTGSGGFAAIGTEGTVNIGGANETLTWGVGGFVPDGDVLRLGSPVANATINWDNGIDLGAAERLVYIREQGTLLDARLNGVIGGTGGLQLIGTGDVELTGLSTFTGALTVGNTVNNTDNLFVYANSLADSGVASSLGAGSTVQLATHGGGLIYNGSADTGTNRTLELGGRDGSVINLNNEGTGNLNWTGAITVSEAGATNTLRLDNSTSTSLGYNEISGVMSDGAGLLRVEALSSTQPWRLSGANTYTGVTTLGSGSILEVTNLQNGGIASSIGASSSDAANLLLVSTLRYVGAGDSTDRLFTVYNQGGGVDSSGTGALAFTNPGELVRGGGNAGYTLRLGGTNTGENIFAPTLTNLAPVVGWANHLHLFKDDPGLWALVTDNNAHDNAYSGTTVVTGGALRLDHAGAITGGLGVTSSHGAVGSPERSSLVLFQGAADGTAGVLGLTALSGGFHRGTTIEGDSYLDENGTPGTLDDDNYVQGVRWQGSGGFAAWDGIQEVNLFGDGRTLTWGADGFVSHNHHLTFGYETADGTVDFQNGIDLGIHNRSIEVNRGLADVDAVLSGQVIGTGGLIKDGGGVLALTGDNTFSGNTVINAGVLHLGDGGTTGDLGDSGLVTLASGTTLVANRSDALQLNAITDGAGGGTLHQLGSGTTTLIESGDVEHVLLQAGTLATSETGDTFAVEDITFTDDGGAAFRAGGTVSATGGVATAVIGGVSNDLLVVDADGALLATGDLGAGDDVLDLDGTFDSDGVAFALGDGQDRLVVRDGGGLAASSSVDGGTDSDTIELNSDVALTFAPTGTANFEILDKEGAGTATLTDVQTYTDVNVNSGVLDVDDTLEAPTIDLADGVTLNVDGTVQAAGATQALITGDAGANTVTVAAGGTLIATGDLGDGADLLDVAGTLDLGGGTFALGAGDDTLTVYEDTAIAGLVDGGAGNNTLNTHITGVSTGIAVVGAIQGFEILDKTGAGTLEIVGAPLSAFQEVQVSEGSLDIGAGGSVTGVVTGAVLAGATLNVDGSYSGTTGADTFTAAGAVTGLGGMDFGDGDDRLIIQDTGDFSAYGALVDGGTGSNTIELNSAAALTFGPTTTTNFDTLDKTGAGTATLIGAQTYVDVNVDGGVLDVDGSLEAPTIGLAEGTTLNVDGTVQAAGASQALITGDAGSSTVTVAAGGTLLATGDLGDGMDVLDIAGTLDTGAGSLSLGDGDDIFVVNDGTNVIGTVAGGAGLDTRVYDLVGTANVGAMQEFEGLTKRNTGTLVLNGPAATDVQEVQVEGGTLSIDAAGSIINAVTTTVEAGALLNVDGTYEGSTGADTFTVAGTVQGGGTVNLDDGDDELILRDGADLNGLASAIEGGAGADTITADIAGAAELNAVSGFESLVKQNTGVLNINGPAASGVGSVDVQGGELNVGAGGSVTEAVATTVTDGATLNVDGVYEGSAGADTFTLAGTVSGASSVQLGDGDDVLTLREGAVLGTQIDGGAHTAGDTLVLDIATTFTFDGVNANAFELLAKQNTGTATLTNSQSFAGTMIESGVLDVDGTLETPTAALADDTTLNVDGTMQAAGATAVAISGSAGANTVSIGAAGTLIASGGLGDGADTLDVAGTLDLGGGVFELGAGDDTFVVYDGTNVIGAVSGGAGLDTRAYDLVGTANVGALQEFEGLTKRNTGTLNVNGPASTTGLLEVNVEGGVLNVGSDAHIEGVQTAQVAAGASLHVDGEFLFTAGVDTFTVAGAVAGSGVIDLLDGDDNLTLRDGADTSGLAQSLEGGAGVDTLTGDIDTSATLGAATGFEILIKEGVGSLTMAGPTGSVFDTVLVHEGLLEVAAGVLVDPETTAVDAGATLAVDGDYHGTAGADTFTLSGELAGAGTIDLLDGDDSLTVNTGADISFTGVFDAGATSTDRLALSGADSDSFDLSLIDTVLQNFDEFHKEGAGTWRLTGAGDHNWTVSEGTLIGDIESFGGDIENAATVVFDQAVDGTYEGMLSGSGTLIKRNAGTLVLPTEQAFAGTTEITGGVLQVDGVLPGTMTVAAGGTLAGIGTVGSVTALAGGFVQPGNSADEFGTLTIAGDYTGGGTVAVNTELGDETSATSRLVIEGDVSGSSTVLVNQAGGDGARTNGDGIEVIQVDGASPADSFQLGQPVQAGAYQYFLHQGSESDANDWYLRSQYAGPGPEPEPGPSFRPGVAGYVLGHQANLEYGFTALGSLRSRVGSQGRALDAQSGSSNDAWMRMSAQEFDVSGTQFEAQDLRMGMLQFGGDLYRSETEQGATHFGVMASLGQGTATFFDRARADAGLEPLAGEVETDVKGAGLYWTHYGARSGYLDVSSQVLHYRNRYSDQFLAASSQRGWGGTLSVEIGAAYALGDTAWKIEPQLQLAYQRLELDDFTDDVSVVSAVKEDALRARAGVQFFRAADEWLGMSNASPYVGFGVQQDLRDADSIAVGSTALNDEIPDTTADASVGFAGTVGRGVELLLDVRYQQATGGEKDGVRANFGFRKRF